MSNKPVVATDKPLRKNIRWRTFWIYTGLGPPIGSALGMLLVGAMIMADPSYTMPAEFLAAVVMFVVMTSVIGLIIGVIPAAITGAVAAFLHREREPAWRSVGIGCGCGLATSAIWALIITNFSQPHEFHAFLSGAGAFSGAACALLQRRRERATQ